MKTRTTPPPKKNKLLGETGEEKTRGADCQNEFSAEQDHLALSQQLQIRGQNPRALDTCTELSVWILAAHVKMSEFSSNERKLFSWRDVWALPFQTVQALVRASSLPYHCLSFA